MAVINPHINFNGNAEEAFNFYKSVFGGEFAKIIRFKDIPNAEYLIAENELNKIMLIELPVGENMLLANDIPEIMGRVNENENRSKISVRAHSSDEAEKLYRGLSEGGNIEVPFDNTSPAPYFGMFRDKFGIEWIVDYNPEDIW